MFWTRGRQNSRSLTKLLLGRAERSANWPKSDWWDDWHKEHSAGAIDYHDLYGAENLIPVKLA